MSSVEIDKIHGKLLQIYEARYTNPKAVLHYRISELVRAGKTREEAIITLYEEEGKLTSAQAEKLRKRGEEAVMKKPEEVVRAPKKLGLLKRVRERVFAVPIEVLETLLDQYQKAGVNAKLLPKDSEEAIEGKPCIKVEGKQFDLVYVTFAGGATMHAKGVYAGTTIEHKKEKVLSILRFHHIIKGLGDRSEEDLKTELKAEKKGFMKKKLVDVSWEGALAEKLNSDTDLKRRLLESDTDNLNIEPDKENDFIRITLKKGIWLVAETKIIFVGKTKMKAENLPSMEVFDIVNKIAEYVKSV